MGTVTDGAVGIDWNRDCPICGKERGNNCQNKTSFLKCPNEGVECKNKDDDNDRSGCRGYLIGNLGQSSCLAKNILVSTYDIPREAKSPTKDSLKERIKNGKEDTSIIDKGSHPLYVGHNSIQAHHLICAEFMKDEDEKWLNVCKITGYNVNCKLNGIYLPASMKLACFLKMPRHAGSHYMGRGYVKVEDEVMIKSYVDAVEIELNIILETFSFKETQKQCEPETATDVVRKMNRLSAEICEKILSFDWSIAWDSINYAPMGETGFRIGCANSNNLPEKRTKILNVLSEELEEKKLIPEGLSSGANWKPKDFNDMETIEEELAKKEQDEQDTLCCNSYKIHYDDYAEILYYKTKKFKTTVGH